MREDIPAQRASVAAEEPPSAAPVVGASSYILTPAYMMVGVQVVPGIRELAVLSNINSVILAYDAPAKKLARDVVGALRGLGLQVATYEVNRPCQGLGHRLDEATEIASIMRSYPTSIAASMGSPCIICAVKLAKVLYHRPTLEPSTITTLTSLGIYGRPPLHVAVPVGAAMGREADGLARAVGDGGRSVVAMNKELTPEAVILDPALTVSFRPAEARDAVFDLFTHTFEAVATTLVSPLSRDYALLALRRLSRALPILEPNKAIVGQRLGSLWRELGLMSLYTGLAVASSSVSLTCALAVATQEEFPTLPHGTVSAVYLPHVIKLYEAKAGGRADEFVGLLREAGIMNVIGETEKASDAAVKVLSKLEAPRSLQELGLRDEEVGARVDTIARRALELGGRTCPFSLTEDELRNLILQAYRGF